MNRRGFLKRLGAGVVVALTCPIFKDFEVDQWSPYPKTNCDFDLAEVTTKTLKARAEKLRANLTASNRLYSMGRQ